jgi:hypothetical protein
MAGLLSARHLSGTYELSRVLFYPGEQESSQNVPPSSPSPSPSSYHWILEPGLYCGELRLIFKLRTSLLAREDTQEEEMEDEDGDDKEEDEGIDKEDPDVVVAADFQKEEFEVADRQEEKDRKEMETQRKQTTEDDMVANVVGTEEEKSQEMMEVNMDAEEEEIEDEKVKDLVLVILLQTQGDENIELERLRPFLSSLRQLEDVQQLSLGGVALSLSKLLPRGDSYFSCCGPEDSTWLIYGRPLLLTPAQLGFLNL